MNKSNVDIREARKEEITVIKAGKCLGCGHIFWRLGQKGSAFPYVVERAAERLSDSLDA